MVHAEAKVEAAAEAKAHEAQAEALFKASQVTKAEAEAGQEAEALQAVAEMDAAGGFKQWIGLKESRSADSLAGVAAAPAQVAAAPAKVADAPAKVAAASAKVAAAPAQAQAPDQKWRPPPLEKAAASFEHAGFRTKEAAKKILVRLRLSPSPPPH